MLRMPIKSIRVAPTAYTRRVAAAAIILAAPLAGCNLDKALKVADIDVATPQSVKEKSALPTVLAGAIGDFQVAYSAGGEDSQISLSALLTDEYQWVETFPTRFEVDARSIQPLNGTMTGLFRNIQRARVSGVRAATAFAALDPASLGRAEALTLEGFSYVLMGENYCSGVPFSTFTDAGVPQYGQPLATRAIFAAAIVRFDSALKVLAARNDVGPALGPNLMRVNFAKVGRARALLDMASTSADLPAAAASAAAAVAGVPTGFQYQIQHSENTFRENNGVYFGQYVGRRYSVADREGGNGLPYRSDNDPRVPYALGVGSLSTGQSGDPMYLQTKYPTRSSPVTVADGVEARLIEAEAALASGDFVGWLTTLNTLRATGGVSGLNPLVDPGTPQARVDLTFKERAYWLWLTSHRLGDLRRLVRQYDRPSESVFPTGPFFKGGVYGPDVNFPIPFDETNNPNFTQCIDRKA
ncbi:MAG: hypothetical protein NVS4B3_15070 [Gemmatimonadaceae bacterium]